MGWRADKTKAVEIPLSVARGVDLGDGLQARVITFSLTCITQAAAVELLDEWKVPTEGDLRLLADVNVGDTAAMVTGFEHAGATIPAGARFVIGDDPTVYRLQDDHGTGAGGTGFSLKPPSRQRVVAGSRVQFIAVLGRQPGVVARQKDASGQWEVTVSYAERGT